MDEYYRLTQQERKRLYEAYLTTPEWKAKRKACLKRAGYKCELCGTKFALLHVHHLTYKHIFHERPEDLQCLCQKCHGDVDPRCRKHRRPRIAKQMDVEFLRSVRLEP